MCRLFVKLERQRTLTSNDVNEESLAWTCREDKSDVQ